MVEAVSTPETGGLGNLITLVPDGHRWATKYRALRKLRERIVEVEKELGNLIICGGESYNEAKEGLRKARELVDEEIARLEKTVAQAIVKALAKQLLEG